MGSELRNQEASTSEILDAISRLKSDLSQQSERQYQQLSDKINGFQKRVFNLERTVDEYKQKFELVDKLRRKNNIVIHGIDQASTLDQPALLGVVQDLFKNRLGIALERTEVNNLFLVGKKREIVKVELLSFLRKIEILNNSRKLKGTTVYISHDLSKPEQEIQKVLRQHLRLAKEKKYKAYIRGSVLIVNGDKYTAEQLQSRCTFDGVIKSSSAPPTPKRGKSDTQDNSEVDADSDRIYGESQKEWQGVSGREGTAEVLTRSQVVEGLLRGAEGHCQSQRVLRSGSVDEKGSEDEAGLATYQGSSLEKRRVPARNVKPRDNFLNKKIKGG